MRHGYLIDMDGVLYRGSELIPGADQFIRELRVRDIPFRFLTNNSQRTRRDVAAKLARMGVEKNLCAIVRFNNQDGFALFPPSMTPTGEFIENEATSVAGPEHSAEDRLRVLGEMQE